VKVPVRESADIVVASAGGYPRDINLYQAHKAIENASHAIKNGGTIVLVAECREGFGNTTFEDWMTGPSSLDEVGERLSKQFILGAHKAFALSKIAKRAEIIVASNKLQAKSIILKTCKKPQDALNEAWRSQGKDASILLMPYAMNTLPEMPSGL
jgi:nickel-dependent lactate racemase